MNVAATRFKFIMAFPILFAFGRQHSCLPKALKALFDPTFPPHRLYIENIYYDTFDDQ
jgi:hypothetical protein